MWHELAAPVVTASMGNDVDEQSVPEVVRITARRRAQLKLKPKETKGDAWAFVYRRLHEALRFQLAASTEVTERFDWDSWAKAMTAKATKHGQSLAIDGQAVIALQLTATPWRSLCGGYALRATSQGIL